VLFKIIPSLRYLLYHRFKFVHVVVQFVLYDVLGGYEVVLYHLLCRLVALPCRPVFSVNGGRIRQDVAGSVHF